MPYWTAQDVAFLIEQVKEGQPLVEIGLKLGRSVDSLKMKLKRLKLTIPEKCLAKSGRKKDTFSTTTTLPKKLQAVEFSQIPSPNEALGLLWAAVRRLQDPDVGKDEVRKLRLIVQAVKSYIHLDYDYVGRIRQVEKNALAEWKFIESELQLKLERAETPDQRAALEQRLREARSVIAEMIEMGIQEPRKELRRVKEVF
jgi:hypothetical protein